MRDVDYFYNFIKENEKRVKKNKGYSVYGSRVIDILDLYVSIESHEEKEEFQNALVRMLISNNPDEVKLAIVICTGFIDFRFKYMK